jgi:hypothetical protein
MSMFDTETSLFAEPRQKCTTCGRDVVMDPGETTPGLHAPAWSEWEGEKPLPLCSGSNISAKDRAAFEAHPDWYFA